MAEVECLEGCGSYTRDHFLVTAGRFRDVCRREHLEETKEAVDDAHIKDILDNISGVVKGINENVVPPDNAGRPQIRFGRYYRPIDVTEVKIFY